MTDRPILFSGPMVCAILGGRKTQTRRVFKGIERLDSGGWHIFGNGGGAFEVREEFVPRFAPDYVRYAAGDRLWVREAHHRTNDSTDSHLVGYDFADGPIPREDRHHVDGVGDVQFFRHSLGGWRGRTSKNYPGIHMPRWASRLTLTVTDVRVQRLYEISADDIHAEGVEWGLADYRDRFHQLWDSLNASRGYGWDTLPWVIALTFSVARQNIDEVQS